MFDWLDLTAVVFMVWFLLIVIKKIRTKKGELDAFVFFVALAAEIIFVRFNQPGIPVIIARGLSYGGFLFSVLLFDLRTVFQKDLTKLQLKKLKKDFDDLADRSELLRQRFITMLDLLDDGIAFRTDDDMMYGTKAYIDLVPFEEHEFSYEMFLMRMHPDDRSSYKETLNKTSRRKPDFHTKYRMKHKNEYVWIQEKGTRLEYQKRTMFITLIKGLDVKKYPGTNVDVLNQLAIDSAYFEHIQALNHKRNPYTIVVFELSNIPAINEKYGRDIGDLMMGEFITKMAYHFLKDIHAVFRLTGIRFAMVITDFRKVEMLRRALEQGGDLINYRMRFGDVEESVYPSFGLHHVKIFDEPVDATAERVMKALNIALDETTPENYFIIR